MAAACQTAHALLSQQTFGNSASCDQQQPLASGILLANQISAGTADLPLNLSQLETGLLASEPVPEDSRHIETCHSAADSAAMVDQQKPTLCSSPGWAGQEQLSRQTWSAQPLFNPGADKPGTGAQPRQLQNHNEDSEGQKHWQHPRTHTEIQAAPAPAHNEADAGPAQVRSKLIAKAGPPPAPM